MSDSSHRSAGRSESRAIRGRTPRAARTILRRRSSFSNEDDSVILSPSERCPLHKNYKCPCHRIQGRKQAKGSKWETVRLGVRRIRDQFADHPDGYRYKLSHAEMRKVLLKKIEEQDGKCAGCGKAFETLIGISPDHIKPRGMNAARRDDRAENIQALCDACQYEKGSRRPAA